MKAKVLYSSKTGNTKLIAEAIFNALPAGAEIHNIGEITSLGESGLVFFGVWIDKGTMDNASREALPLIATKKVALFATLGAEPDSDHAKRALESVSVLLREQRCEIMGTFICQGKIDPAIIEMMKMMGQGQDNPHRMTPEREARHREAAKHPDKTDLENAVTFAKAMIAPLQ